jgi:integrase
MADHVQVIHLEHFKAAEPSQPKPFGTIITRKRSSKVAVRFRYYGKEVQKTLGLDNTPGNQQRARAFLDKVGAAIRDGSFRFAEVFPGASYEEKVSFSRLEGQEYRQGPESVTFGQYVADWRRKHLDTDPSERKRKDYASILRVHLLPAFDTTTFADLRGMDVIEFVRDLRGLTPSTIRNILIPLRIIWEDAVEEHDWDLKSPFDHLRRRNRQGQIIPNRKKNIPRVYRVAEWEALMAEFDPWYRPVCELRIRTGVHAKELGALRTEHISGDRLHVPGTKSEYRDREIPITSALRPWLDILTQRATDDRLITSHRGIGYNKTIHNRFRGRYWLPAHDQAGIAYRNPYVTRHTFIAWGLRIGTHPDRMVELAGHGSRQMIYERYGMNQKGLEEDVTQIRELLGADFT